MKIEILYPQLTTLFGEAVGLRYFRSCIPDAEWIETSLFTEPHFVREKVDMVYMGPMTEKSQELIINELRPYKDKIIEYIDSGCVFLAIGNALEIFGKCIENEDGTKIEALGLFDTVAKRKMLNRYNSLFLGSLEGHKIVGFKSQFAHSYTSSDIDTVFDIIKGDGLYPGYKGEGIRRKNFIGTYLLGPLYVTNPDFTKYLLKLLGVENPVLPFEKDIYKAYEKRVSEFENPKKKYLR